jgi:hypothetical protein
MFPLSLQVARASQAFRTIGARESALGAKFCKLESMVPINLTGFQNLSGLKLSIFYSIPKRTLGKLCELCG